MAAHKSWDRSIAEHMYKDKKSDAEIAKACGVSRKNIFYWRKTRGLSPNVPPVNLLHYNTTEKMNPCADCQRHISECPWLNSGSPVLGWDARLVSRKGSRNGKTHWYTTWQINACPKYIEPDKGREKRV